MKTFTPVTSRIQTLTRSLGGGRFQDAFCPLATMLGRRVALPLLFVCAAVLVQPCAAAPFHWAFTGSLNAGRYYHTATLLLNGKVLVAGGWSEDHPHNGIMSSAELYDPATGNWTRTIG